MHKLFGAIANLCAIIGVALCGAGGLARVSGMYRVANFEAMTLFNVGVGLMIFAILLKLESLLRR